MSAGFVTSLVRNGNAKIALPTDCRTEWKECRAAFGRGARGIFRQSGFPPDVVAAMLGFDSDDTLREALLAELRSEKQDVSEHAAMIHEQEAAARERRQRTVYLEHRGGEWTGETPDGQLVAGVDGLSVSGFLESLGFVVKIDREDTCHA